VGPIPLIQEKRSCTPGGSYSPFGKKKESAFLSQEGANPKKGQTPLSYGERISEQSHWRFCIRGGDTSLKVKPKLFELGPETASPLGRWALIASSSFSIGRGRVDLIKIRQ